MNPRWQTILKEYSEALIIALVLALIIRTFIIQAFKIPSGSMLETLQIGDRLFVTKFAYDIKVPFTDWELLSLDDPEHGDIIVFRFPEDPSKDFIKRVAGLPGDTVEVRGQTLYRNGEPVDEPYLTLHPGPTRKNFGPQTVPEDHYFVLGDNRFNSHDSRFWGFVPRSQIKGKAWRIYWSASPGWFLSDIRWDRIGSAIE
jgi:signal peptidase I